MKKALLVGINKYSNAPLRGCVNDCVMVFQILTSKFGFKRENMRILEDYDATKENIVAGLKWLTQGVSSGDTIVFHYSGHGSQVMVDDWTATEEVDGRDEILVPINISWDNPLRDHEVGAYFKRVPKDCETLVIMDSCLAGGTKIPLLDGTTKTIKELNENGGEYWVYSIDDDGNIVPGKAHSARVTGYRELIKITFDNGDVLECTDDHKILLKNGKYKEAGKLTKEDSLMPLYRKISDKQYGMIGYEMCFSEGKWKFTHHIVRDFFNMKKKGRRTICHHIDINKRNNAPENLEMVSWEEHQKMHGEIGAKNLKKLWQNEEFLKWRNSDLYKKQQSYVIKEKWQDPEYRKLMLDALHNSERAKNGFIEEKKRMIKMNKDPKISKKQMKWQKTKEGKLKLKKEMINRNKDPEYQRKCMRARILGFINTIDDLKNYDIEKPKLLPKLENIHKYFDRDEDIIELANNYNHKIIKIEYTGRKEYVYDLTVDKFHNFAVESGIFVHNCHSGTGLRNGFDPGDKFTDNDYVNRFISPPVSNILKNGSIIINDDLSFGFPDPKTDCRAAKNNFLVNTADQGDAILISGCQENQTSADAWLSNRYQGAMTYTLGHVLQKYNYDITYSKLVTEMNKILDKYKFTQNPQLECVEEFFNKKFLK